MNKNFKKVIVPFIIMVIINLCTYYLSLGNNFGEGYSLHNGILLISGMLFGPYGILGAVVGNTMCDLIRGYNIWVTICSEIVSAAISILAYKLWYEYSRGREVITKPRLNGTFQLLLFIGILLLCSVLYAVLHKELFFFFDKETASINFIIGVRYLVNVFNSSFIFGIIGIWISRYIDFVHIPEKSEKKINLKFYYVVAILLVISLIVVSLIDFYVNPGDSVRIIEVLVIALLLFIYITKPITAIVSEVAEHSIPENIMNIFLIMTLMMIAISYIIASDKILTTALSSNLPVNFYEIELYVFIAMDFLLLLFFIPSFLVLRYIETNVVNPIISFSQIEKFIKKGDKIESEGLVDMYSTYTQKEDEIGVLARSYTDLIEYTNEYIENIHNIEGEKQRMFAELDVAEKIQRANLPTSTIENEHYSVFGYSQPAKMVGGDFYDYYALDDDNLAIVIGDASGKGIPAALLSTITQTIIKQVINTERNPSKILYGLNNQLCENNPESMFITLWIGIYNKNSQVLTFSNAGHNPPLVKEDGEYKSLTMDEGIALGVMDNYEYVKEEIPIHDKLVLYTDGITDAINLEDKFYGESHLVEYLNSLSDDDDIIEKVLEDINEFTQNEDQFDDMTLLVLEKH